MEESYGKRWREKQIINILLFNASFFMVERSWHENHPWLDRYRSTWTRGTMIGRLLQFITRHLFWGRGKGDFSVRRWSVLRVFFIPTVLNEGSNGAVYQDISRLTSVSHRHLHNRGELCECMCVWCLYMKWPLLLGTQERGKSWAVCFSNHWSQGNDYLVHFSVPSKSSASACVS